MAVESFIVGDQGLGGIGKVIAHVHPFKTAGGATHIGLVVLTHPLVETEPGASFFLNDSFGAAMNQAVTFGSAAVVIHDGGDTSNSDSGTADTDTPNHIIQSGKTFTSTVAVGSYATATNTGHVTAVANTDLTCSADICPNGNEAYTIDPVWTGAAVQGTWNFADSAKITLTSANDNDNATFTAAAVARYDWANFTAFTGKVDLDTFSDANHTIVMQFELNGVLVGNSVNLNDFINTSGFAEQGFVIPKTSLGLGSGELVNSLRVTLLRSGGAKPTFKLDDLQMESTGDPLLFTLSVEKDKKFHIHELTFAYADEIEGKLVDGTMPNISYNAILGVSALGNGFNITRKKGGKTLSSANIKTLGDHISAGARPDSPWHDDTNTFLTLRVIFQDPLLLSGDVNDTLTIQINDDMSGLLQFTCSARGSLEG